MDNRDYLYLTGFSGQIIYDIQNDIFHHEDAASDWVQYVTRGTSEADVFSTGSGSEISHYNGSTYYAYSDVKSIADGQGKWYGLSVTQTLVSAVGTAVINYQNVAYVAIGTRDD